MHAVESTGRERLAALDTLTEGFAGEAFAAAPTCPICGGAGTVRHAARNIHPQKALDFDFRGCRSCRHGWIDPMPAQALLSHLYALGSSSVIGKFAAPTLSKPERLCAERELAGAPRRYFELGVGQGSLYARFAERGWTCIGVDPGDWSQGLPGVRRRFEDEPAAFRADLLVAFDVLEHVADPVAVLRTLRGLAAPKGRLYCAMPNCESARARVQRERWRMLRPLGHVNYFSRKSVAAALASAGFELRELQPTDLHDVRMPRSLHEAVLDAIELLGVGDQWFAMAEAR